MYTKFIRLALYALLVQLMLTQRHQTVARAGEWHISRVSSSLQRWGLPAFSYDGRYCAIVFEREKQPFGYALRIFDCEGWNPIEIPDYIVPKHGNCTAICWSAGRAEYLCEIRDQGMHFLEWRLSSIKGDKSQIVRNYRNGICDVPPLLSSDSNWILFGDRGNGEDRVFRYRISDRTIETANVKIAIYPESCAWAFDCNSIWIGSGSYSRDEASPDDGVFRAYFDDRTPLQLCKLPRAIRIHPSGDGRWLAIEVAHDAMIEGRRPNLAIVKVPTGEVRELGPIDIQTDPVWRPDSKSLAWSDGPIIRLYDPEKSKISENIKIDGARSQPFWNPKDNSLWVSTTRSPKIMRWNGSEWKLILILEP